MFILYAESYGSIRTFALKHDDGVQPNRDLLALGGGQPRVGSFQGTPVGAGYSGTSANEAAGAQSRFAGLSAAAVLGAGAAVPPVDRAHPAAGAGGDRHSRGQQVVAHGVFRNYFRWQRDRLVALAAVLAVMVFGVLNGLLVAIAFSLACCCVRW